MLRGRTWREAPDGGEAGRWLQVDADVGENAVLTLKPPGAMTRFFELE